MSSYPSTAVDYSDEPPVDSSSAAHDSSYPSYSDAPPADGQQDSRRDRERGRERERERDRDDHAPHGGDSSAPRAFRVFLGSHGLRESDVHRWVEPFCKPIHVLMKINYAFVEVGSEKEMDELITGLDGTTQDGKVIRCQKAQTREERMRSRPSEPYRRDYSRPSYEVKSCFICGRQDHWARDCPTAREEDKNRCFNCMSPDHFARDCPKPRQPRQPRPQGAGSYAPRDYDNRDRRDYRDRYDRRSPSPRGRSRSPPRGRSRSPRRSGSPRYDRRSSRSPERYDYRRDRDDRRYSDYPPRSGYMPPPPPSSYPPPHYSHSSYPPAAYAPPPHYGQPRGRSRSRSRSPARRRSPEPPARGGYP